MTSTVIQKYMVKLKCLIATDSKQLKYEAIVFVLSKIPDSVWNFKLVALV